MKTSTVSGRGDAYCSLRSRLFHDHIDYGDDDGGDDHNDGGDDHNHHDHDHKV